MRPTLPHKVEAAKNAEKTAHEPLLNKVPDLEFKAVDQEQKPVEDPEDVFDIVIEAKPVERKPQALEAKKAFLEQEEKSASSLESLIILNDDQVEAAKKEVKTAQEALLNQ